MTTLFFIAAALSTVTQPAAQARSIEPVSWGEFSRFQGRGHRITVTLGTLPSEVRGQPVYWAKRVGVIEGGATDSLKCPALTVLVESIERIPMPTPAPRYPQTLIGDGTVFSITVPHSSTNLDQLTITAGSGPLADWVDNALMKLEGCWSPT